MNSNTLRRLRKATVSIKRLPGAVVVLNQFRRIFFKNSASVRVDDFDGDLSINLRLNEHMQSQIFWYGFYSRDILSVLRRLLKPGMVVADVGANIGEVTLVAAKLVGESGRVYAFEPLLEIANELSQNVRLNGFNQVLIQEAGLSDRAGMAELFRASADFRDGSKHEGLATLYSSESRSAKAGEVSLTTLDLFCEEAGVRRLDLIKMDIEGAELFALRGGIATLRKFKPYVLVEVQQETAAQAGYDAEDILVFLQSEGYEFDVIGRNGRLCSIDSASLGKFQNILCSPAKEN